MNKSMKRSPLRSTLSLLTFVGICLAVGGIGAAWTTPEIDGWYRSLAKPPWNPPDAVFGPVWTSLYLMMAVAIWLVWESSSQRDSSFAIKLFFAQLFLNCIWSWIFFRMHCPGWAFSEIVILWFSIAATMIVFFSRSRIAGWLLVPYLAWVSFASVLNFMIWRLNA